MLASSGDSIQLVTATYKTNSIRQMALEMPNAAD